MKNSNKDIKNTLESTPAFVVGSQELLSELELTMTQSSMGYEYTLKELENSGHFGFDNEKLQMQLDEFQNMYLEAREKFYNIDSDRLEEFEIDLKRQKAVLFNCGEKVLH